MQLASQSPKSLRQFEAQSSRGRHRKMCFVVQIHLGKGAAARPRCIPQAVALSGR